MILINKQTKLSSHMSLVLINDRPLIKHIMLIWFSSAKFLLQGVTVVHFSNDHNIVSNLIVGTYSSQRHTSHQTNFTGPHSSAGNLSSNRCESDCRSRGRKFDPGQVPYIRGDWSWNNFYGHSPPFRWIIQDGLLSVTSESMCMKYWLTAYSSLPRKKCG